MFEEQIGDSRYTRFESDDWELLEGKRLSGHGKIVEWTNAEGEPHPAFVRTEDGRIFTPEDLALLDFDGRHGFVDFQPQAELA